MRYLAPALFFVAALLSAAPTPAEETEAPPPLGTRVADLGVARVVERVIDGRPLRAAELPAQMGPGLAVLLVPASGEEENAEGEVEGDEGIPREVWALSPDPAQPPRRLAAGLPATVDEMRLRGDEIWLGGDGVIYRLDHAGQPTAAARPILASPGLDLALLDRSGLLSTAGGGVALPELGRIRLYDADLEPAGELELPVRAERTRRDLVLSSPSVVRRTHRGADRYFAGPEARPGHRLRVGLLDPTSPALQSDAPVDEPPVDQPPAGELPGDEPVAAWVRLPGPEEVVRSTFLTIDGEPRLAVTTMDAGKIGIFAEQRLRLYALQADRTRGGLGPLLAAQTASKRWYRVGLYARDTDGDGDDDLVVLQPEGMGGGDLVIQVYRGLGSGKISIARPKRTKLDVEASDWHWGDDVDGDGLPDLLLASRREGIRLLRGVDHRRRVVDDDPSWTLTGRDLRAATRTLDGDDGPYPSGHFSRIGTLRTHQLDDDPASEISLAWGREGRTVVRFVLPR